MKSIKPGRGPSMLRVISSVFCAIFGVVWTVIALKSDVKIMALFGVAFVGVAIVNAVYFYKNATQKNRYSMYDITEEGKEPDPLNEKYHYTERSDSHPSVESRFCPYCGTKVEGDYQYCNCCGKKLP